MVRDIPEKNGVIELNPDN